MLIQLPMQCGSAILSALPDMSQIMGGGDSMQMLMVVMGTLTKCTLLTIRE